MQSTHNLTPPAAPDLDEVQEDTTDDAMALVLRVNERLGRSGDTPPGGVPQVA